MTMVATGMEENKNLGTGWIWRVFRIKESEESGTFQISGLSELGRRWCYRLGSPGGNRKKFACRTLIRLLWGSKPVEGGRKKAELNRLRSRSILGPQEGLSQPNTELWNGDVPFKWSPDEAEGPDLHCPTPVGHGCGCLWKGE